MIGFILKGHPARSQQKIILITSSKNKESFELLEARGVPRESLPLFSEELTPSRIQDVIDALKKERKFMNVIEVGQGLSDDQVNRVLASGIVTPTATKGGYLSVREQKRALERVGLGKEVWLQIPSSVTGIQLTPAGRVGLGAAWGAGTASWWGIGYAVYNLFVDSEE